MTDLRIDNARVLQPHGGVAGATVYVENGRIVTVATRPNNKTSAADPALADEVVDARGRLLTPGLIDLHIHGIETSLFETGPEALLEGLAALPCYGVTTVLPTLYRVLGPEHLDHLRELAEALVACDTVHAPGFHLEGPFLKLAGAGGLTMAGEVAHLDALLDACAGRVAAMSLSPDTPGTPGIVPVIERLVERGVAPFITHTQATYEQTRTAIDAGARHATHFYDVFPAPEATDGGVRPVGCVEAVLEDPRVSVDFIADGVHVHPGAIRLAWRCKGSDGEASGRVCLITDANIGAGMPPGRYPTPWGFAVEVGGERGGARIAEPNHPNYGCLAGSVLTMPQAVANARQWLDVPEHDVWSMASANPARVMGLSDRGHLRPGFDADLVLWDEDAGGKLTPACTWLRGRCVHRSATLMEVTA